MKAKYQPLVIRKIIRAVDKDKQLPRTSILKAMMMLKTAWYEVTEKKFLTVMKDHDDPFKEIMDDGEDDSAVEELESDLNQLRETRLDLVPEKLTLMDSLILTEMWRPTNLGHCLTEIVTEYLAQPAETVENISINKDEVPDEPMSPPSRNEVDGAFEI